MGTKNLKEIVYDSVLKSIYSSEYMANEIITEASLMKKYGYSKSPVREALMALCQEGILKNIPRCGYQVVALTSKDIQQIMEFRIALETGMLRRTIDQMTEPYFENLEELAILCNRTTEDVFEHWIYNTNFHVALISASNNTYACDQLRNSMKTLWRAYVQLRWNTWENSSPTDMRHHFDIVEALRARDIERAVQLVHNDLNDFGHPGVNV